MTRTRAWVAIAAALSVVAASLVSVVGAAPSAEAATTISLDVKQVVAGSSDQRGTDSILAGDDAEYVLTATNGGTDPGYNLGFSMLVPRGVEWVSSNYGEPKEYDNVASTLGEPVSGDDDLVLWVWEDVADLPAGAFLALDLVVHPDQPARTLNGFTGATDVFPVGSDYSFDATAHLSGDARYLPVFNGSTGVGGGTSLDSATKTTTTNVVALELRKDEPSPESELLRGVHDDTTIYNLVVTNTKEFETDAAKVVDYVPAGLEFLGCGAVDNGSDTDSEQSQTGIPALNPPSISTLPTTYTANARTGCKLPDSVETKQLASADLPYAGTSDAMPAGVYTVVTWSIGDLPAGSKTTLRYRAAVPLFENTPFPAGTRTTPDGTHPLAVQAANLDNNTGPSTRQGDGGSFAFDSSLANRKKDDGDVWRNAAVASGRFVGTAHGSDAAAANTHRDSSDTDDEVIDAMDLRILKSVSSTQFATGSTPTFTLTVNTGEYATAADITITDTAHNGLCPLVSSSANLHVAGESTLANYPSECQATGTVSGATVTSVTFHPSTGEFTMVLDLGVTLPVNGTRTITYEALERPQYTDARPGANGVGDTTSGDSFGNYVEIAGRTTLTTAASAALAAQNDPTGTEDVWDDSAAMITSDYTQIDKDVLPRDDVTPGSTPCSATTGWLSGDDAATTPGGFQAGDTVCYRLTVDYSSLIATRNPVVDDFIPHGQTYAGSSVLAGVAAIQNSPTPGASSVRSLEWLAGTPGAGGDRYVQPNGVLQILVWTTVTAPASGLVVDKPQNLMKYRQENVDAVVYFLRDAANIERDPSIQLTKGVVAISGLTVPAVSGASAGSVFGSNRDHIQMDEGDTATFRLDILGGSVAESNVTVVDTLPGGITCVDVSNSSPIAGTCAVVGTHSEYTWVIPSIPADGEYTLQYTMSIASTDAAGSELDNTARVTSFQILPNGSTTPVTFVPGSTGATAYPDALTSDDSSVYLQHATVVKSVSTDTTYNSNTQAAIGEYISYTYSVTIPAHTSVHNGLLYDAPPPGITIDAAFTPISAYSDGAGGTTPPAGAVFTPNAGLGEWALSYDNATAHPDTFSVTVRGYLTTPLTSSLDNWAHFTSTADAAGTLPLPEQKDDAAVTAAAPHLTITKTVNGAATKSAALDADLTYTVKVTNDGSSKAFGPGAGGAGITVVDTLPATGLSAPTAISGGGVYDATTRTITWTLSAPLATGSGSAITYTYHSRFVRSDLTTASAIPNTVATSSYFSLPSSDPDIARATTYLPSNATAKVTPQFPSIAVTKTVDSDPSYIGATAGTGYTVKIVNSGAGAAQTVKAVDTLPAGWEYIAGSATLGATVAGATTIGDPSASGQTLTWSNLGTLAGSTTEYLHYSARPASSSTWTAGNTGRGVDQTNNIAISVTDASGESSGPTDYSATSSAAAHIDRADLSITKTHSGSLVAGDPGGLVWTLHVANAAGADHAVGTVTVTDTLPAHTALVGTPDAPGWHYTDVAGLMTFTRTVDLTGGAAVADDIVITTTVDSAFDTADTSLNPIDNTAHVGLDGTFESALGNNTATDAAPIVADADLHLDKSVASGTYVAGMGFTWTINVDNIGPSAALLPLTVVDHLPSGITVPGVTWVGANWTCATPDVVASTVTCTWDDGGTRLAVGAATDTLTVTTPVGSGTGTTLTNSATVSSPMTDVVLANNTHLASSISALARADISVVKSLASPTLTAGTTATYRFTVDNAGPSDAVNEKVTDTLPVGLTYAGNVSTADWTCSAAPDPVTSRDVVTCAQVSTVMVPHATSDFTFDVHVASNLDGSPVVNTAHVTSGTPEDPADTGDDTSTVTTTPVVSSALTIAKDASATVVEAGDPLDYTLAVANTGPADAKDVVVTDTVPAGFTLGKVAVAPNPASPTYACTTSGNALRCVLDADLVASASAPAITVSVTVDADVHVNSLTNVGQVAWTTLASPSVLTASDPATVDVKWVHYDGASACESDVPWFSYSVTTSPLVDTTALPVTIGWYKDQDHDGVPEAPTSTERDPIVDDPTAGPVAVYTIAAGAATLTTDRGDTYPVTVAGTGSGRTLSGRVLWPGAGVDEHGVGVAYPGYRVAGPGETPTYQNMLYDPAGYGANLRAGALIRIHVNPTTQVVQSYPAATAACAAKRSPAISITKVASVTTTAPGADFTYTLAVKNTGYGTAHPVTLKDPVPSSLKVDSIEVQDPVTSDTPAWDHCAIANRGAGGFGGTVTCSMSGYLGWNQSAGDVLLHVTLTRDDVSQPVKNTATVTWLDPAGGASGSAAAAAIVSSPAAIDAAGGLAFTGMDDIALLVGGAATLVAVGVAMLLVRRRRPKHRG